MTTNGHQDTFGCDGSILFVGGNGYLVYRFVKTHQNVCLKSAHFSHEDYTSIKLILEETKCCVKRTDETVECNVREL